MDKQLFESLLSTVAEWYRPRTLEDANLSKPGRPKKQDTTLEPNPTLPPQIVKLKPLPTPCEHCDRICENGRGIDKRQYSVSGVTHWRQKCVCCNFYQNPYTGRFDLNGVASNKVWLQYIYEVLKKKPKKNTA
jgi:hypothetical protein